MAADFPPLHSARITGEAGLFLMKTRYSILGAVLVMTCTFGTKAGAVVKNDFYYGVEAQAQGYNLEWTYYVPWASAGGTTTATPPPQPPGTSYPLIVYLHGAGEIGKPNGTQLNGSGAGSFALLEDPSHPAIMVAPILPANSSWSGAGYQAVIQAILATMQSAYNIDPARIYVTGVSYGGAGTWGSIYRYPNKFAAGIPIIGAVTMDVRAEIAEVAKKPIWIFHGDSDTTQHTNNSIWASDHIRDWGYNVLFTLFTDTGHTGSSDAYKTKGLTDWLFSQTLGNLVGDQPRCEILSPTSSGTFNTSSPTINLSGINSLDTLQGTWTSGTVTGSVKSVAWRVINFATKAETATGNATSSDNFVNWSANGIPLQIGDNLIEIISSGPSWTTRAGVTTFNDTIRVIYTLDGSGDVTPPSIGITTPTPLANYGASSSSIALSGTADDNANLISVTWSNNRGGSGTAAGTANWSVASIPLQTGVNVLTLVAHDSAGNTTSTICTVTYSTSNQAPIVGAGPDLKLALPVNLLVLNGVVTNDDLPDGVPVTVAWTQQSGPGVVTFGAASQANTTAVFPTDGTYVLRLTASDGLLSAYDEVTVRVFAFGEIDWGPGESIGADMPPGGNAYDSSTDTYTVSGGGWRIFNFDDSFYYANIGLVGDGRIVAKLTSNPAHKAGVMIRQNNDIDSAEVCIVQSGSALAFHRRNSPSSNTLNSQVSNILPPIWMRLTRMGNDFKAERSTNGTSWTQMGTTQTIVMDPSVRIGLVVCSGTDFAKTATFTNVRINQAPAANAGLDTTITLPNNSVVLTGVAMDDGMPLGNSMTASWSKVSGAGTVIFGNASALVTTGTFSEPGTYVLRLTVNDGEFTGSDDVQVVINPAPVSSKESWRSVQFGANASNPAIAGDAADPDGDGVVNLMEYALGGDPNLVSSNGLPAASMISSHLQLSFTRLEPTDVTYEVQASTDLTAWSAITTFLANGNAWTGSATVNESGTGATRSVTVQDTVITGSGVKRFLRVRVTSP